MINSLTLDNNNKEITYARIMPNLGNCLVILKSNNSALAQQNSSSLYSTFILNWPIVSEINNWPHNPSNDFKTKNC